MTNSLLHHRKISIYIIVCCLIIVCLACSAAASDVHPVTASASSSSSGIAGGSTNDDIYMVDEYIADERNSLTPVFAIVASRHGDRTPAHASLRTVPSLLNDTMWPADPHCPSPASIIVHSGRLFGKIFHARPIDTHFSGVGGHCAMGQLTRRGHAQHEQLGSWLRQRYMHQLKLISESNVSREVHFEATNIARAQDSAMSQMHGLLGGSSAGDQTQQQQPFMYIHTTDIDTTDLFPNGAMCPRLNMLLDRVRNSPDWVQYHEQLEPFKQHIASLLGLEPSSSLPSWTALYDVFFCRSMNGVPLPFGADNSTVDRLIQIAEHEWRMYLYGFGSEYTILGIQPLMNRVKRMLQRIIDGFNSTRDRSHSTIELSPMRLVSLNGHDTTIAPLAAFLGIENGSTFKWPKYAGFIALELYRRAGSSTAHDQFFVVAMHDGTPKLIPGCVSYFCPWDVFDRITTHLESEEQMKRICMMET